MVEVCTFRNDIVGATSHAEALSGFAPDFLSTAPHRELVLYQHEEHNRLGRDGIDAYRLLADPGHAG